MNVFDYLDWRGDIKLSADPLNEIDSMIFTRLSYIPFDGIVSESFLESKKLKEAADEFFLSDDAESKVIQKEDYDLIKSLYENERFMDLDILGYVNQFDYNKEKQFSALTIRLSDNNYFVSFRGTDNTIVGWKEDLNMSFAAPIPSQLEAVSYLDRFAAQTEGDIIVGGHSKGGNLAIYASAFCSDETQERIVSIYNMDGPGFDLSRINKEGYNRICDRINTYIPQDSIIGLLLEHEEKYTVIRSNQTGLLQHDVYNWEVLRNHFIYLEETTRESKFIDKTLKNWIINLDYDQRKKFVDTLYSMIENTNSHTIEELSDKWYLNSLIMLKSFTNMDEDIRKSFWRTMIDLIKSANKSARSQITERFELESKTADE